MVAVPFFVTTVAVVWGGMTVGGLVMSIIMAVCQFLDNQVDLSLWDSVRIAWIPSCEW